MYLGVFDLKNRLEHTKRLLNEKVRLKELLEQDIEQLERDLEHLQKILQQNIS